MAFVNLSANIIIVCRSLLQTKFCAISQIYVKKYIHQVYLIYGRTDEECKKIGWKDGVRAIYCILKYGMFGAK